MWVRLVDSDGDHVVLNMALAESFYRTPNGYTRITFSQYREWSVKETVEEIMALISYGAGQ